MVCREGYSLRPGQLLGTYTYCKAVAADDASVIGCSAPNQPGLAVVFTSVSHFNLIHCSCHAAAKAADGALRTPKREWDGAMLRNGQVRVEQSLHHCVRVHEAAALRLCTPCTAARVPSKACQASM